MYEVADGLDYIHSKKLVHRDIKPGNILISLKSQIKISDFGLSKQINTQGICSMSGLKGTALWMAPELLSENTVSKATPNSDIFPCGCVFFVFLTCENENGAFHPFGDMLNNHIDLQVNIRDGNPVNFNREHIRYCSTTGIVFMRIPFFQV